MRSPPLLQRLSAAVVVIVVPLLLAASCVCAAPIPHRAILNGFTPSQRVRAAGILAPAYAGLEARRAAAQANAPHLFRVTDYGGDPTGRSDSSAAFQAAVAALLATAQPTPYDAHMKSCGGAVLDLAGGNFSVSQPVTIPRGYGEYYVRDGTLVAAPAFPPESFVLAVGTANASTHASDHAAAATAGVWRGAGPKFSTMDVGVQDLTIIGAGVAAGGLLVKDTLYASVGPAVLVMRFTHVGVSFNGTGGSQLHDSWLGETAPSGGNRSAVQSTAVTLDGGEHDGFVQNVVVWSSRVGVYSVNGANQLGGVHVWNLNAAQGGQGIVVNRFSRVDNCYIDTTQLTVLDSEGVVVTNTLFLNSATLVVSSATATGRANNLLVTNNVFHGSNTTIVWDPAVHFVQVTDVVVTQNAVDSTTVALSTTAAATWSPFQSPSFDFSRTMAVPLQLAPLQQVQCTYLSEDTSPVATAVVVSGFNVTVNAARVSAADRVSCVVDQANRSTTAV